MNVSARLNRLLASDGKCFDVSIDHGFFGEASFLSGIENMASAVQTVVSAAPDVVQLSVGQARHLQSIRGPNKPGLVLRIATFLRLALADALIKPILHNQPLLETSGDDARVFLRWTKDGKNLNPERPRHHQSWRARDCLCERLWFLEPVLCGV